MWHIVQERNGAGVQSPDHGRVIYVVHVRNEEAPADTWASLVREAMDATQLDEYALAEEIGTNRTTVWRWLQERTRPANVPTVERFAAATGIDLNRALRVAGFAPRGTAPADEAQSVPPGFNPSDPIVRKILAANVDDERRAEMFAHYRRRLDEAKADIDFMERYAPKESAGGMDSAA
jgi:hypothetical protein